MRIIDCGPLAATGRDGEVLVCHTVTTADGETSDVCRALSRDAAIALARNLLTEALGRP